MNLPGSEAHRQDVIGEWEWETGLEFDPEGPELAECECGKLIQFITDHHCYVMAGNNHEARMMSDGGE